MGDVGILNVAAGDTKLVFDNSNPGETERAARIVTDMLRRGFALFIEVGRDEKGPIYRRAHDFDPETKEYIVAGSPGDVEEAHVQEPTKAPRARRQTKTRVPATRTNAVAVARTAGG